MADETLGNDVIVPISVDTSGVDQSLADLESRIDSLRSKLLDLTADSSEYLAIQNELINTTGQLASANDTFTSSLTEVASAGENVAQTAESINTGFETATAGTSSLSEALTIVSTELTQSGESARDAAQGTQWYQQTLSELKDGAGLANVTLNELKATQRDLQKEMANQTTGSEKWLELRDDLNLVQDSIREYNTLLRETEGATEQSTNTIAAMRAEVRELSKQWANTDMGSPEFEQLTVNLAESTERLKQFEASVGNNRRDVANYRGQIEGLFKDMGALNGVFPGAAKGATAFGTSIKGLSTAFKALLANPIILVITGVVALFTALGKALKSSEEMTQRFNAVLAPLKLVMDAVLNVLQTIVGWILSGIEAIGKLIGTIGRLLERLPLIGKYIGQANDARERAIELERAQYALDQRTRDIQVENAKNSRDIAELRAQSAEKEKRTAEERLALIREAGRLERQNADNNLEIAKEELQIAEERAKRARNNKKTEQELAQLRANVYNAERTYAENMRRINTQEATFLREIETERKAAADAAKKANDERVAAAQKNAEELAEVEKRLTTQIQTEYDNRRDALLKQYQTDLAILQKNGQDTARLTAQYEKALTQIQKDEAAARSANANASISDEIKRIDARYKAISEAEKVNTENLKTQRTEAQTALIEAQRSEDSAAIEAAQNRLNQITQLEQESNRQRLENERTRLTERLALLQESLNNDLLIGNERIAVEQQIADAINAININSAQQAQALADQRLSRQRAYAQAEVKIQKEKAEAERKIQNTINDFSEAGLNLLGEHTVAAKILGSAQAVVNTWVGASQALTLPFPANIAAMAATITAGLKAVSEIWKVKVPGESNGAMPDITMPTIIPNAAYDMQLAETHTNLTSDEITEINQTQKVYVLESDIADAGRRVQVVEDERTF